jgi:hypothetical protein
MNRNYTFLATFVQQRRRRILIFDEIYKMCPCISYTIKNAIYQDLFY